MDGRYILKSDQYTDICIYLDGEKKCTVYEARPDNVSHFHFGQRMSALTGLGN